MNGRRRAPEGYPHGPAAALVAHGAIAALDAPRAVLLVEGVSDRIAVEAVAARTGEDLIAARIAVVATGGVHGLRRMLRDLDAQHPAARVSGLYDVGEREIVRHALESERLLRPGADPEPWASSPARKISRTS